MLENRIEEVIALKCQEGEFQDVFAIEISISPKKEVEIILDADEGLTIEKCRRISRHVENWLDTEGSLGEEYTIEVSSPGVSRSLMMLRQYPKHIGRTLEVKDTEGVFSEGIFTSIEGDSIVLTIEEIKKEGKKKIKETIIKSIPFEKIKTAFVKIKF